MISAWNSVYETLVPSQGRTRIRFATFGLEAMRVDEGCLSDTR